MASAAISLGTDALGVGLSLLTQHSARVKDAKNENAATQSALNAQVADIQQVASSLKSGQISINDAITFIEQEDAAIETYLKAQVGKPGTAWDGTGNCSKTCTIGCCFYYGWIHGGFNNTIKALQQLQQTGQPVTYNYAAIGGDKYGLIGRNAFSVTFQSPSVGSATSLVGGVTSAVSQVTSTLGSVFTPSSSPVSHSSMALIVIVVAMIALIVILGRK